MGIDIRSCRPEELERLIFLLDDEFVFGKGRAISLRLRFPTVYCFSNLSNILLCMDGEKIASALAMRPFDWCADGEIFRGAMIGAVYTHAEQRRKGLASRLLEAAAIQLREKGTDFGILWTGQQSFYARLGWVAVDCSVLGEVKPGNFGMETSDGVARMQMPAGALLAEGIRRRGLNSMILRRPEDYRQLPLPAERVDFLWHENQGKAAYALLGSSGEAGFLYELAGDVTCFPALWREACRDRQQVFINDRTGSTSCCWLTDHAEVGWENKKLAMWLPFSERVGIHRVKQWHIPYFDRI